MQEISRGIFVVAPNNYDVVGNGEDDNGDLGVSVPFREENTGL